MMVVHDVDLKEKLASRFPGWNLSIEECGLATWVYLNDGNHYFSMQVTPSDGVGVSVINKDSDLDMSGHDEAFDDFDRAVNYIEEVVSA